MFYSCVFYSLSSTDQPGRGSENECNLNVIFKANLLGLLLFYLCTAAGLTRW